jgi:hypothetical protein
VTWPDGRTALEVPETRLDPLELELSQASHRTVQFAVTVTPTNSADVNTSPVTYYTIPDRTLTLPPGVTHVELGSVLNDGFYEPEPDALTVTLTPVGATPTITASTVHLSITSDDPRPTLDVSGAASEAAGGQATVTLDGPELDVPEPVTFTPQPLGGADAADIPADLAGTPVTVTLPAGQGSISAPLSIVDDSIFEGSQPFALTAGTPDLGSAQTDVPIVDNDPQPAVSIEGGRVQEGSSVTLRATLAAPAEHEVYYQVTASGCALESPCPRGSATTSPSRTVQAVDLTTQFQELVFAPGTTTGTVHFDTAADLLDEGDETFAVVGMPFGGTGTNLATVTITDSYPHALRAPSLPGTVVPGTITCDPGDWSGSWASTSYTWRVNHVIKYGGVGGATFDASRVAPGAQITCEVTRTIQTSDGFGHLSTQVGPVTSNTAVVRLPSLSLSAAIPVAGNLLKVGKKPKQLPIPFTCVLPTRCHGVLTVRAGKRLVGRGTVSVASGASASVRAKVTAAGRKALTGKSTHVTISVALKEGGSTQTLQRAIIVRRG